MLCVVREMRNMTFSFIFSFFLIKFSVLCTRVVYTNCQVPLANIFFAKGTKILHNFSHSWLVWYIYASFTHKVHFKVLPWIAFLRTKFRFASQRRPGEESGIFARFFFLLLCKHSLETAATKQKNMWKQRQHSNEHKEEREREGDKEHYSAIAVFANEHQREPCSHIKVKAEQQKGQKTLNQDETKW